MRLDKNRNNNSNELTIQPYGLAYQLATIYEESYDGLMGEVLIQKLAHSTLKHIPSTEQGIIDALEYLNQRIESVRKTISAWDAYQIKGTVQDRSLLLGQLSQLPANSSLVSNIATPFNWTDELNNLHTIHKGDIFMKDQEGKVHLIPSLSSGFYKPDADHVTQQGNNVTIPYLYETEIPANPEVPIEIPITISNEPEGYNINREFGAKEDYELTPIYLSDTDLTNEDILMPVIKWYTTDHEQIFQDTSYSIRYTGRNKKIYLKNETSLTLICEVK